MVAVNTRSDALHFELGGTRIQTLAAVGTLPGVILRQVSALNGPGVGRISSVGDGSAVRWQAPQSDRAGTPVTITGDGEYLLEDGEDIGRFLRIEAVQSFLKPQAMASRVYLKEVYLNGFAQQDVTAHPTTFQFVVYSVTMKNYSPHTLKKLLVWVDPDSDVSISSTALGPWSNPKTEAAGTSFPDLVSGGTDLLYLRVGVSAASNAYAKILNHIHARYYAPF